MTNHDGERRAPRTVLEQKIWERHQTFEEFVEYAEKYARDHNEPATLSLRHLQRLAAGHRGDGRPLGPVRPATARLLERIFGIPIAELLSPPKPQNPDNLGDELRQRLNASRRVDPPLLALLAEQINGLRLLDRQLGAPIAYREMAAKETQLTQLMTHSLLPTTRAQLAALVTETSALAGWAALDLGHISSSWQHHEHAKTAARQAPPPISPALTAYATAQQAVILTDLGETNTATQQIAHARTLAAENAPPLLNVWLVAAHGESLAAAGHHCDALKAFDQADTLMPTDPTDPVLPYVFLGGAHLTRWRGHALATLNDQEAIPVLTQALHHLDPSFTRAQTTLQTDLATALTTHDNPDQAHQHHQHAWKLATEIGSTRQRTRLCKLREQITQRVN